MKLAQYDRMMKSACCFTLAMVFRFGTLGNEVFAQVQRDPALMQLRIDNMNHAIEERNNAIDKHLESTDANVRIIDERGRQLSERVTLLQGLGEGGFGAIGVLEAIGLLAPYVSKKAG